MREDDRDGAHDGEWSGYHSRDRFALADFALREVGARGRALDIGCAEGRLGRELLQRGFAEVWGVEPEPAPAKRASELLTRVIADRFPCAGVEAGAPFDLIVLADSLEHMIDTEAVLRGVRALLGKEGRLVISIPNVSHYSIVKALALGRWTYTDEGLLDRTHLRFFTPSEMRAALAAAGFSVVAEESVMRRPRRRWTPLVKLLEARAPHLFVWQQYVAATRDDAG